MLSNSRFYIFKIRYKEQYWLDILSANELAGLIANTLKDGLPELQFKNLQFINVYENDLFNCELHINKLKYKNKRIIAKEDSGKLCRKLAGQLSKINQFSYKEIQLVNDEFSKQPSIGFLKEDLFYV